MSAPVGSMLAGSGSFVARAKRVRKMLGGAMRQAGVVAAAGILALEAGIARVAEDHERARRLSSALAGLPGVRVDPSQVETNCVLADFEPSGIPASAVVAALSERGIRAGGWPAWTVCFMTHRNIGDGDIEALLGSLEEILSAADKGEAGS